MEFLENQREKWQDNRKIRRLQNERERLVLLSVRGSIPKDVASYRVHQINDEIEELYLGISDF